MHFAPLKNLLVPPLGGTRNFFVGASRGKMRFWGGKNPKICQELILLILAIYFFWRGKVQSLTGGGGNSPMPPPPLDAATGAATVWHHSQQWCKLGFTAIIPIRFVLHKTLFIIKQLTCHSNDVDWSLDKDLPSWMLWLFIKPTVLKCSDPCTFRKCSSYSLVLLLLMYFLRNRELQYKWQTWKLYRYQLLWWFNINRKTSSL